MNIKQYVLAHGGTCFRGCPVLARIARRARCSPDTLYMIALGHKRPSAAFAARLEGASEGGITRAALRPDVFGPVRRRSHA